jgi:hypothetical protein
MIVTIHQPSYLPWIPFIEKALKSDIFVLLDDVEFEKNSEQNRNRIKTAQGAAWLTVPVNYHLHILIPDVTIPEAQKTWNIKHRKAIEQNYARAPFYQSVAPPLFSLLDREWPRLLDLNLAIETLFFEFAGFRGRVVRSSQLPVSGTKSERILSICTALGVTTYLSGQAGIDYLDLDSFAGNGIEILFQNYLHGEYPQLFAKAGFIPRLSALDLFMNVGIESEVQRIILAGADWLSAEEMLKKEPGTGKAD